MDPGRQRMRGEGGMGIQRRAGQRKEKEKEEEETVVETRREPGRQRCMCLPAGRVWERAARRGWRRGESEKRAPFAVCIFLCAGCVDDDPLLVLLFFQGKHTHKHASRHMAARRLHRPLRRPTSPVQRPNAGGVQLACARSIRSIGLSRSAAA